MTTLHDKLRAFDASLPLARACTIPAGWYRDGEIYDVERQQVFGRTWLAAGRRELVAKPGAFLTAEVAGEPYLVVRDEGGVLRGFHNVCRHRAAPLRTEACGEATRFRCRYHGWTYDLAGRLRGAPEFDGVEDFRREENGLVPTAVAEWGPLVWVHALPESRSLQEHVAPLTELLAATGMESLVFVERREYELACNWKVYVDNYLDGGYHLQTVHPGLAGVLDYTSYRTEVAEFVSVQSSPLKPATSQAGLEVGQVRGGDNAYYAYVFPNLMLNVYQDYMDTNLVLPLGPERCRVVFEYYFKPGIAADQMRDSVAVSHQIQLEDVGICEEVQRGLASRAFSTGRYSVRREVAVHSFHLLLARRLQEAV